MAGFFAGALTLDAYVVITTSGNNNDIPLNGSLIEIVVSNDMDALTGVDPGDITQGFLILIVNTGPTNNLIIKNNSSSSIAQNRILSANGSDYVVGPYNTAIMGYDTANSVWHIIRVPDSVPSGSIQMWGVTTAPVNWLLCDGTSYLRATYPGLFGAIGTTYGAVDSTHFNVPDMRQRFPLGLAASGTGSTLAGTGGLIDHIHTVDPPSTTSSTDGSHTHTVDPSPVTSSTPSATIGSISLLGIGSAASATHTHSVDIPSTTSSSDGSHTHTVDVVSFNSGTANPPYLVVNYIIKI